MKDSDYGEMARVFHRKPLGSISEADAAKLQAFTESPPKVKAAIRSDPRQISLLGPEHEKELQEIYGKKQKDDVDDGVLSRLVGAALEGFEAGRNV